MARLTSRILIVGAGPSGLSCALTLARQGITCRIVDRLNDAIKTSNALAVQPRTLELWEKLGIIDAALAQGLPLRAMNLATSSRDLGRVSFDKLPSKYPYILALSQHITERILTEQLFALGVEIERNLEVTNLRQSDSQVDVQLGSETATFDWVIAADGAKSSIRQAVGIDFPGYSLPEHFIMADLHIDWKRHPKEGHAFLTDWGPMVFFPQDGEGFGRLIMGVSHHARLKTETAPSLADFQKLVDDRCPIVAKLSDASWTSGFWVHSRLAERYRAGRVFLVGDAAHQHSPVGGQGMNTGIQDAYFLCERLAKVAAGKASPEILDDYEAVRRPIGQSIVRGATFATKVISTRSSMLQFLRNSALWIGLHIPFIRNRAALQISQLKLR